MENTVDKVLRIAEAEVGYLEKRSNSQLDSKTGNAGSGNYTRYWRDIAPGINGSAWCQCFVNWIFMQAYGAAEAKKLLHMENGWSYYTPTAAQYFKNNKQWYASPQIGDIIYFKNSMRIHHVGIVYEVESGRVYTIEGNTSGGSDTVIANGGGVFKKSYTIGSSSIAGYGRPLYDTVSNKSGWYAENGGWKFYLGDTVKPVTSDWYQWTGKDGGKYWSFFLDTGLAIQNNWYKYNGIWYFFGENCDMYTSRWVHWKNKDYYLTADGSMAADAYIKSHDGTKYYYVDPDGIWDSSKDTTTPPIKKIKI